MKLNNNHKLNKLLGQILLGQNLVDLKRLNPIFKYPVPDVTNAGVTVKYPDSRLEKGLRKAISDLQVSDPSVIEMFFDDIGKRGFKDTALWIVVENIAVSYFYKIEENINKPYARYFLFKEAPLYIQALARPALKLYKKSVVTISDDLPLSIRMTVNLHGENQRGDILNTIADFLNAQELIGVNDIIRDKSISLREELDNILKRTGGKAQSDFSYCLTCGRKIESGKKFWDARKYNYKNKNQCLIQFNYCKTYAFEPSTQSR